MSRGITDFAKKTKNRLTYRSAVSLRTAKSYFIPHEDNAHKPFIIRPGALRFYSIVLIITKLAVTGFMYASYPSPAFFSSASSTNIVNLTNSSRQANGMTDLDVSEELNLAAYQKAQDMVNNNYFSHESPSGARFWNWIIGAGYQYTTAGENLAMDFNSAEAVHNALMASATHRKNILNANFTEVGVSIISGKINGKDTTVLVEMFGNPKVAVVAPEPEPQPEPQPEPEPTPEPTPPPPQNVNTATTNTAPEPQPEPEPTPEPVYTAEIVSKMDDSLNIKTTEEVEYWVDIKNTGNTTWLSFGDNFVALNVTDPAGKESLFAYSSWLEKYRPTKLTDNIAPNETARFSFMLKAPIEANVYEESFQLVAENITWIDGSYFKLPITVVKPVPVNTNIAAPVNQNSNNAVTQPNFVATTNSNLSIVPADTEVTPFVIAASNTVKEPKDFLNYLNKYSNIIFWTILILVAIALSISTVVKFRIQHASTVIPSLLVILLASLMLFMRFHFIQNLGSQPIIL